MIMAEVDFTERFNGTVMKDQVVFFCQSICILSFSSPSSFFFFFKLE